MRLGDLLSPVQYALEILNGIENVEGNLPEDGNDVEEALSLAKKALEVKIPKKVHIPKWDTARCPTCGMELSESVGDGYYKHPTFLAVCPNIECCQRLDWDEENGEDEEVDNVAQNGSETEHSETNCCNMEFIQKRFERVM